MASTEIPIDGDFDIEKTWYEGHRGSKLPEPRAKFRAGDKVQMTVTDVSGRVSKTFVIKEMAVQGQKCTYQLKDKSTQALYAGGEYFPEDKLERDR